MLQWCWVATEQMCCLSLRRVHVAVTSTLLRHQLPPCVIPAAARFSCGTHCLPLQPMW
jgi:hypothetical protein